MASKNSESLSERSECGSKFPSWLKRPIAFSGKQKAVFDSIHATGLHTVCVEAKCPNRSECYAKGTATFLIMGDVCTRFCTFCSVSHGSPASPDYNEPQKIVNAIKKLNLHHVVITSVTRDDLPDGGASVYADTITKVKAAVPGTTIEVLIPDFQGDPAALEKVVSCKPDVFNHNIETVPRLYPHIRPQAQYQRSLDVLKYASDAQLKVKSGIMVGLGESAEEVQAVMNDLYRHGCRIITIGQYLQPSKQQTPVVEFITPGQFETYSAIGKKTGFSHVFSGSYIRSSYMAEEVFQDVQR